MGIDGNGNDLACSGDFIGFKARPLSTKQDCAAPVCLASRTAVFSGRMPDQTGVFSNWGKTQGKPDQQGGVLVVGADGRVRYGYASEVAGDHPPVEKVLRLAHEAAMRGAA